MSYTVEVSLQEVKAFVEFDGITLNPLGTIPFSANKDTDLEFADTITFSVDNPDSSNNYFWELENENGFKTAIGQSVKQDYAEEGLYDVNLIASDTTGVIGRNFKENFVKVDFQLQPQLLDDVPGAAAAYSVRLLDTNYSDGLLRVRAVDGNGTDQGEADVKPDGNITPDGSVTISLNSPIENLDSNATGRGLSNSDTLGDLVDSGGSNYDGFVPKWYEQSPNARHATNTTASEQPQIVDAGGLVKENGKPALKRRSNNITGFDATFDLQEEATAFAVYVGAGNNYLFDQRPNGNNRWLLRSDLVGQGNFTTVNFAEKVQNQISILFSGTAGSIARDKGTQLFKGNFGTNSSFDGIRIMNSGSDSNTLQVFQELILYNNNQSANFSKIENLQNDFYQIPNF